MQNLHILSLLLVLLLLLPHDRPPKAPPSPSRRRRTPRLSRSPKSSTLLQPTVAVIAQLGAGFRGRRSPVRRRSSPPADALDPISAIVADLSLHQRRPVWEIDQLGQRVESSAVTYQIFDRILTMLRRLAYDLCYTPHRCHNHKVNRNDSKCRGMRSSVSSYLPYQQGDVSRNYRNCSTNKFLCKQRAIVIFNYQLKIGFDNSSQFSSRRPLVFSTNGSFGPNFLSQENGFKRFFSSSKEINLLTSPSPKEVSKKAAAGNGKLPQRLSLTTLFRGSQRTKKLTTYNSLHEEVKVNGSQQSTEVGTSKSEVSKKNKPVDSKRKNRVSKAKSNKTKDTKIQTQESIQNDALSDVVKVKCQKTSRAEKTHGSGKSIKTKASGEFSYLEKAGKGRGELAPLFPPDGKSVMVVESATKAKTIQNYLGEWFDVLPTYGHVRDLAGRSGSVRPDDEFSMVWEVPSSAWTHLKTIKVALTGAQNLILATDPDREGEAIAWHLIEMLHQQDALNKDINVSRVVFHEITDAAIKNSLLSPRDLDLNLINAYLARRALDYLIGFNVSPLLWRKLPGCQSAGRVQSAALALICDREMEIDQFKPQEYWTVEVGFLKTDNDASIMTELTHFDSKKLNQFSIGTQMEAQSIENKILSSNFVVLSSKTNNIHRNPPMPYITSSLQQDSANKLHFAAAYTMKLAQKLYEGVILSDEKATGLITYMRTDGLHISDAAAKDVHSLIKERYGQNFASKDIRKYFKKVKNAQEAHEAIRPTNISRLPSSLVGILDEDSLKLYTLIWVRTLACQMEAAVSNLIQVDIGSIEKNIILHGSGSKLEFLGYHAAYKDSEAGIIRLSDSEDIASNDETFRVLSSLKVKDQLHLKKVESKQHHTKPPGRYSEGSLVKKLEELGIGRPSTYAPILKVLQDRKYVMTKNRVLYPEFRGRMVSAFLSHHFSEVSDYSFTADMENELDNVSAGATEWKGLLKDYWSRFKSYCDLAGNVNIRQLEKMLEKKFGHILFGDIPDQSRTCPSCLEGSLVFKISRYGTGYFIGCDQHPKCKHISGSVLSEDEDDIHPGKPDGCFQPKLLGHSPDTDEKILLKKGPYGYYVQLGDDRKECPPKRASLEVKDIDSLTVEDAMELLRYPISLGNHPEDGAPVILSHSKCGFSIRHRRTISPVPKTKDPKKITLEVALKLLTSKKAKQTGRRTNKPVYTDKILSSL